MRFRLSVAVLLALALGSFALPARADEPTPTVYYDPNAYPPPGTRWGLAAAGVGAFAVWYGGAVGFSYLWPDAPGAEHLRTPLVGPWLALGDTGCADDDPDCSTFIVVLRAILTTIDGVGQAGGIAAVGEALFLPTVEPGPGPPPRRMRLERPSSSKLSVTPMVTHSGALGLGLSGAF